ncbi:hypothetical protein CDAR_167611 [Caerostris darwini]|uniref:Uncharacterized protein n=1 Tax=Caerostris darwini TaxID=1538125 RepID=A0AAV4M6V0_9ARAC|nr:hypothetical protein CDAR_167611 [Caerostris darwini]
MCLGMQWDKRGLEDVINGNGQGVVLKRNQTDSFFGPTMPNRELDSFQADGAHPPIAAIPFLSVLTCKQRFIIFDNFPSRGARPTPFQKEQQKDIAAKRPR